MLLGTLRDLLNGKRDLFKGLWLDQSDYDFKPYPVMLLSMAGLKKREKDFKRSLVNSLNYEAIIHGLAPL
jgi:hypothetical protein